MFLIVIFFWTSEIFASFYLFLYLSPASKELWFNLVKSSSILILPIPFNVCYRQDFGLDYSVCTLYSELFFACFLFPSSLWSCWFKSSRKKKKNPQEIFLISVLIYQSIQCNQHCCFSFSLPEESPMKFSNVTMFLIIYQDFNIQLQITGYPTFWQHSTWTLTVLGLLD